MRLKRTFFLENLDENIFFIMRCGVFRLIILKLTLLFYCNKTVSTMTSMNFEIRLLISSRLMFNNRLRSAIQLILKRDLTDDRAQLQRFRFFIPLLKRSDLSISSKFQDNYVTS